MVLCFREYLRSTGGFSFYLQTSLFALKGIGLNLYLSSRFQLGLNAFNATPRCSVFLCLGLMLFQCIIMKKSVLPSNS